MKKIGWQKYEDYIEKQLTSPLLTNLIHNIAAAHALDIDDKELEDEDDEGYEDEDDEKKPLGLLTSFLPITNQLMEDISMLSSFDCWIGYTNFDLTHSIKDTLDNIPGVELLKICSRYRFFIGVGKMFDFKDVRKHIDEALTEEED